MAAQQLGRNIHEPAVRAAFSDLPIEKIIPHLLEHHRGCHFLKEYAGVCERFGWTPLAWHGRPKPWAFSAPTDIVGIIRATMAGTAPDARDEHLALMRKRFHAEDLVRDIIRKKDPT